MALQDTESGRETGIQGFVKLSVTVLGPEDRQRVHDLAEEIQVGLIIQQKQKLKGMNGWKEEV